MAEKNGKFIRIQAKYVTPKEGKLYVNCQSSNNWSVLQYTSEEIDCIAVFDPIDSKVYYVPVSEIRRSAMTLRLNPPKNGQKCKVRYANQFDEFIAKDAPLPSLLVSDDLAFVQYPFPSGRYPSGQRGLTVNQVDSVLQRFEPSPAHCAGVIQW